MKKFSIVAILLSFVCCATSFAKERDFSTHLYNTYNRQYYEQLTQLPQRHLDPQFTVVSLPQKHAKIYQQDSMRISKTHPIHQCSSLAARMIDEKLEFVCVERQLTVLPVLP